MATTISSGVGETRAIHCPGSYMRAARVDRTVTVFSQVDCHRRSESRQNPAV
jgi:hypothetical protein